MRRDACFRGGMTLVVAGLALSFSGAAAHAQTVTTERQTVNSPAAAPAATVVQAPPVQQVQVQPNPVVTSRQVVTDTHSENFMATIAKSTFYGALAGGLVGGAIYFIDRDNIRGVTVGYWAAGGALVGAGVGILEVSMREERNERAVGQLMGGGRKANFSFVPRVVNVRF